VLCAVLLLACTQIARASPIESEEAAEVEELKIASAEVNNDNDEAAVPFEEENADAGLNEIESNGDALQDDDDGDDEEEKEIELTPEQNEKKNGLDIPVCAQHDDSYALHLR